MPPPKPKKTQKPRQPKRKTTKVSQSSESTDIAADEAVYKEGVTVWCQDTMEDTSAHTRYERVSKMSSDSLLVGVNTPQSDKDRLKHIELMKICTTPQKKVLDPEDVPKGTKTAQQTKIDGLERRIKKLEKKQRSRTHKLKRLYKVGLTTRVISSSNDKALDKEDTSKHGRIDKIDADEDIALVSTHDDVSTQDNIVQDEGIDDVGEEEVFEVVTTAKMIINAVVDATQVTTAIADILVSAAETIVTTAPTIIAKSTKTNVEVQEKDKGKAKLIEKHEMPKKRKYQIRADKELAEKLQAEINEEDRLARERAQKEQEGNDVLINTWDDIQAMIDADAQLAQRLHEEEQLQLIDAEKANMFMEFKEKRRKFFAAKWMKKRGTNHLPKLNKEFLYFDREDVKTLWKLVKAKYGSTRPEEDYDRVLWGDLKVMFDLHVEDEVSKLQQTYRVVRWMLFNSCGVHCLSLQSGHIYMLVKKRYSLTPVTITYMLNKKLHTDYFDEMTYQLLKLVTKQLKNK
uniref:Uncharacterized protein n=1 Tax=Tanacetum cinerariifolium TaxID=118510 RepID=A0A699J647_TANCI|nr:hypothetical protein [Tanacetum cinerariifolium]